VQSIGTLPAGVGNDHDAFTFRHQGLDQKLVGVEAPAHVVKGLLA